MSYFIRLIWTLAYVLGRKATMRELIDAILNKR